MKNWWLYVLRLEQGKYYVGITSHINPNTRIKQHGHFASAAWTRKYKPIEMIELLKLGVISVQEAQAIENKRTRELLKQHGLDNVRGGDISFANPQVAVGSRLYDKDELVTQITVASLMVAVAFLVVAVLIK